MSERAARRPEGPAAAATAARRPECRGEGLERRGEAPECLPVDSGSEARAATRAALRQLDTRTLAQLADGRLLPLPGIQELERRHGTRAVGVWVGVMAEAELAGRETMR